jgi:membrane protease subunit (stomatin/prohibitin family)
MGLFHRNENELNFAGGSKNIRESLQEERVAKNILVHLAPQEDFNTGTVVTVNPGEEALFVNNGEIVGVLPNGRHELTTQNYPFLSRIRNMITGGMSTFHCRVFYVRTAHTVIPWGTPNGIQYQDNWFKCPTVARGYGEYRVTFSNIPKFVMKVMGNQPTFTEAELVDYFNGQLASRLTDIVAQRLELLTRERDILALNGMKAELAEMLKPEMQALLDDYGLELVAYYISNLEIDEDERRASAISAATEALAQSRARVQQAKGDVAAYQEYGATYQTIKGMGLLQDVANNPGTGSVAGIGAGLGVGVAAGNVFGQVAQSVFSQMGPTTSPNQQPQQSATTPSPIDELAQFKQLFDNGLITREQFELKQMLVLGLITQAQYEAKIAEIMNRL